MRSMKKITFMSMLFSLLLCICISAKAAVLDRQQFFDLGNCNTTTSIEIVENATGNIIYIVEPQYIQKAYEMLENMKFSNIMTYDTYAKENHVGTSTYTMKFHQKDNTIKQIEITQDNLYTNKWFLSPQQMPNDFYYFTKYMTLIKQNYKKSFSEQDFYKNMILWKDNPIIFSKSENYYNEQHGVMAEFKTLNTVLNGNAVYDLHTQTLSVNGIKANLYGEQIKGITYVAAKDFAQLICYDTVWDDTLKILLIQQRKNDNHRWEKLRGTPKIYGHMNTIFDTNISFENFLNINSQQPLTKVAIKNEKTNYTKTITDETDLQEILDILNHTTVYQIEKQNIQADEPTFRYAVTLYQDNKAVKTFFMTSQNVMKDEIYRVSVSTSFFDWIYHVNEIAYAKAILNQWKVV